MPSFHTSIQVISGNSCCVQFCSRFDFLFAFVFQLLPTFHLFPAKSISWGLSQQGWMASGMLRVEISNISNPGAKSCRVSTHETAQLGFQSQWGLAPRMGYKGLQGEMATGNRKVREKLIYCSCTTHAWFQVTANSCQPLSRKQLVRLSLIMWPSQFSQ